MESSQKLRTARSSKLKSGGGRLVFPVGEDGGGISGLEEAGSWAGRRRKEELEDRATRVARK